MDNGYTLAILMIRVVIKGGAVIGAEDHPARFYAPSLVEGAGTFVQEPISELPQCLAIHAWCTWQANQVLIHPHSISVSRSRFFVVQLDLPTDVGEGKSARKGNQECPCTSGRNRLRGQSFEEGRELRLAPA